MKNGKKRNVLEINEETQRYKSQPTSDNLTLNILGFRTSIGGEHEQGFPAGAGSKN